MRRRASILAARKASTLIIALWALLTLSAIVLAWAKFIDQEIAGLADANFGLDAEALAHSGVAVAMHPLVSADTPILERSFSGNRGYKVRLIGEGGKLNLNWLLAGEDPRKLAILDNYLQLRGLEFHDRAVLIDCMLDWISPGNTHHQNGSSDDGDYHVGHRPFLTLDEVAKVKGSTPLVSQSDWQDDFTLFSQGPVDLQAAPYSVLRVLPGIGDPGAQRFLTARRGPDKIDGTKDDHQFKDIMEAGSYLGMGDAQLQALAGLVTLKDPTFDIVSEGHSGKVYRQVEVVTRKLGGNPTILLWKEF